MSNSNHALVLAIAKVNNQSILIYENGEVKVPIKPICIALGIDDRGQLQKIERHPILSSVACTIHATGTDKKQYEMTALPLRYIFGWLFTIQPNLVKEEAKEFVIQYQMECYNVLYNYFVGAKKFLELKEKSTEEVLSTLRDARRNFATARITRNQAEDKMLVLTRMTYQDYLEIRSQPSETGFPTEEEAFDLFVNGKMEGGKK